MIATDCGGRSSGRCLPATHDPLLATTVDPGYQLVPAFSAESPHPIPESRQFPA